MTRTSIEWADDSWNPIAAYDKETGKRGWFCTKVSPGCTNCYAENWNRFRGNGHLYRVANLDKVRFELAPTLNDPLHWRKPRRVFVNSMTDLFLEAHTNEMIAAVFTVMAQAPQHQFLVLTKRPERMLNWFMIQSLVTTDEALFGASGGRWPLPNVWLGVSVENQTEAHRRIPLLLQTPAAVRFLSCEPLLGPLTFPLEWLAPFKEHDPMLNRTARLDWMIFGGESGRDARPCDVQWIRDGLRECREAGVAAFVKQLGAKAYDSLFAWECVARAYTPGPKQSQLLASFTFDDKKGGDPGEWPEGLCVRQYPKVEALV